MEDLDKPFINHMDATKNPVCSSYLKVCANKGPTVCQCTILWPELLSLEGLVVKECYPKATNYNTKKKDQETGRRVQVSGQPQ